MSEEKKEKRPVAAIQQDFVNLACKAGQLKYQIDVAEKDLKVLMDQMRDLNFEASAAVLEENEKKAKLEKESKNV